MQQDAEAPVKKIIINALINKGKISSANAELYDKAGSVVYVWLRDEYRFGIKVPTDNRNQPALIKYVGRLARFLNMGGKPYRTRYLSSRESRSLFLTVESEFPEYFARLKKVYGDLQI